MRDHMKYYSYTIAFAVLVFALGSHCSALADSSPALTVDRAVQIAMENSLPRKLAKGDVDIAQDRVAQALCAFGPMVTLESGIYRYDDQPTLVQLEQGMVELNNALSTLTSGQVSTMDMPDDSRTYYGIAVELTQPLYTGGRLTAVKKMAEAARDNARYTLKKEDQDLALAVKKAYFTVLLTEQMARALNDAVASMEDHLKEAKVYHKMEIVPRLDVLRAKEKLSDLKQQQLLAANNFTLARTALNYTMGVDFSTQYTFGGQPPLDLFLDDLNALAQEALARRPELSAMDARIQMAEDQVALALSGHLPTVALVGSAHHFEPENIAPSAEVGLVATLKLYDYGRVSHQVALARHELQKAKIAKKQLERGIRLKVEQAFRNAQAARESVEVAQSSIATAQETLNAARTRYKVGLSTSLERLDAEVSMTRARTNHIRALSMYNISVSKLERALGRSIFLCADS